MDIANFVSETLLFQGMDEKTVVQILPLLDGRVREIAPNGFFCRMGNPMTNLGIILKGEITISKLMESGEENLIDKLYERQIVGLDIACTTTGINPYEIYSIRGATIYEFSGMKLLEHGMLPEHCRNIMIGNAMRYLANSNIRHMYKIDILSVNSLQKRIQIYLETRAAKLGKREFTIPFNREELASYLCVNRSALSHELSLMREKGIIDFKKNQFKLL